ncbi:Mu-like prophage protein GP16 [Rhodopseudomonas palustris TIE-1]|uniref:regulatory protein GemA n=1 Tax=Rhodopseudomonas palustris TaxID=1076 RepID=UPI00017795DC|nr:regulatory protein GemA [Rhodopseudomonas palustris]ACE99217.1 Mu-like prophage protein GP16 [Rhodopseudomonas palustris TIE-1]
MKAASAAADVTAPQIAMIHVLAKQAGLDEDCRRDAIERITGKRSARELTAVEGSAVIDHLKSLSKAADIDGPYGKKLRALWISGWHLGVVHNRTDKAMLSFVERQTGIERTRWLRAAADARKAVEALKLWISREGGVQWPAGDDPIAVRRAVIEAQQLRLAAFGQSFQVQHAATDSAADLDKVIARLGARVRTAQADWATRY